MQLRDLPAIDALVNADELESLVTHHGPELIKNHLRDIQGGFRARGEVPEWAGTAKGYAEQLVPLLTSSGYQAVFNLTGTVVHTNLGRSPLSAALWQEVEPLVTQAMNLEYDLASGQRGDRDAVVEDRLVRLTGAEAATVVNNNAAALLLVLNTFALGGKVPVSRGELIEIGGSFRLPDIMERAGCELLEVGTTNRTHLKDFAKVATDAAMFLKVHPSNYHITGFTNTVSTAELAKLANDQQRPLCIDVGSGTLVDLRKFGLPYEPMPQHVLDDGADLVTFSGDKLLGAVQAGVILGKRSYVDALKRNPLKRALRPDKVTLALLDATLKLYEQPDRLPQTLPLLKMLSTPLTILEDRAKELAERLENHLGQFEFSIRPCEGQIGSGALPDQTIESRAVVIGHGDSSRVRDLEARLRQLPQPVIGRIHHEQLWLDVRCVLDTEALFATLEAL